MTHPVDRLWFSRWYLTILIPLILVLPAHDTTTATSRLAPAPAIPATLLMEAIEDAATAFGTLPHGSPPELLQSQKFRAGSFDYLPGLEHHAEADVQLDADLQATDRPVMAELKIQTYETGDLFDTLAPEVEDFIVTCPQNLYHSLC